MNQQEIQINVLLTPSDFVRANYWYLFKKLKWIILLFLVAGVGLPLLVLTGVIVQGTNDNSWGFLVPLAVLVLILGGTYFSSKRQTASHKAINENQRYIFSEQGINNESVSSSGFQQWENIREAYETPTGFLLFLSLNQMYLIPKRCFQNEVQVTDFKELVQRQLGTKLKGK